MMRGDGGEPVAPAGGGGPDPVKQSAGRKGGATPDNRARAEAIRALLRRGMTTSEIMNVMAQGGDPVNAEQIGRIRLRTRAAKAGRAAAKRALTAKPKRKRGRPRKVVAPVAPPPTAAAYVARAAARGDTAPTDATAAVRALVIRLGTERLREIMARIEAGDA